MSVDEILKYSFFELESTIDDIIAKYKSDLKDRSINVYTRLEWSKNPLQWLRTQKIDDFTIDTNYDEKEFTESEFNDLLIEKFFTLKI